MKKTFVSYTFFVIALLVSPCTAMGYRYFYRAGPYQSEPRYDKNCLTSFDVSIMGGSATKSFNGNKNKVNAFQIYGTTDLYQAFANYDDRAFPVNLTVAQRAHIDAFRVLAAADGTEKIGKIDYTGKFKHVGIEMSWTQNFCNGFFAEIKLPIQINHAAKSGYTHQSTTSDTDWSDFEAGLAAILATYDLNQNAAKETTAGDMTVCAGWTYNDDSSEWADFFDVTIKAGLSIPTARQKNPSKAFSIPGGYNGHVGIPVSFDMALGVYEWVTWGAHVGGQFFLNHDGIFRMRINDNESGWIKLFEGGARESLGNLWDIGTYLKADHVAGGQFSLMVGYNYTAQEATTRSPYNTYLFRSTTIVNNDEALKKWRMHTISVMGEYDFAEEGQDWNPKVGAFFNYPVAGKRIFRTWTAGGNAGVNITWKF